MNNTIIDHAIKPNGRFSRRSYLAWNMLIGFVILIIGLITAMFIPNAEQSFSDGAVPIPLLIIFFILYAVSLYFSIIFLIRRLHDRDHSGWMALLILVPVVNIIFGLYILFAPGQAGVNQFGPQRPTRGWENVLAILYVLVMLLGLVAAVMLPSYQNYVERSQQISIERS